jgi:DNA-binding beta-propeller fold protein YncE
MYVPSVEAVVTVYANSSGYLTGVVSTVSGETVTYGTPSVIRSSSTDMTLVGIAYDSDNDYVCVSYQGGSNYPTLVMLYGITTTSFTASSETTINSVGGGGTGLTYDTANNKLVAGYVRSNSLYARVITITAGSPPSASVGSEVTVNTTNVSNNFDIGFDVGQGSIVFAYDWASGDATYVEVGQVSGTSITFGTGDDITGGTRRAGKVRVLYDTASSKSLVIIMSSTNNSFCHCPITVSGTSFTAGTFTEEAIYFFYMDAIYYEQANKAVVFGSLTTASQEINVYLVTVSGTSSSSTSQGSLVNTSTSPYPGRPASVASENNVLETYRYTGNTIQSKIYTPAHNATNLTATNFIGLAAGAISDTASGDINVKGGINEAQTGLTIGADYYVQNDGSLLSTSIPYDISSASYDSVSFSVNSQDSSPSDIAFNNDGTKMFVLGYANDAVYEYTLSTGFDISTATYSQNFSVASQDTYPTGIAFNTNGTKMFVVGQTNDAVYEYTLTTGFDVSTASYSQSFSVATQELNPQGITFNTDGTKMYVCGFAGDDVNEYGLTTGFDISTASYSQNFSVASEETTPTGIRFNSDGTKMFVIGAISDAVHEYGLSTGFDVSTASLSQSFSVASQDDAPTGLAFNSDGTKMFMVGNSANAVYQYSTTPASTTVKVGQAISATTINMMDLT